MTTPSSTSPSNPPRATMAEVAQFLIERERKRVADRLCHLQTDLEDAVMRGPNLRAAHVRELRSAIDDIQWSLTRIEALDELKPATQP